MLSSCLQKALDSEFSAVPKYPMSKDTLLFSSPATGETRSKPSKLLSKPKVGFIGLVASSTRGEAVLCELDLSKEDQAAIRTPVGLDIGARTAEEIALSVLAELVRSVRIDGLAPPPVESPKAPESAVDPVCGMTVMVGADTAHVALDGVDYWFCNPGCRSRFCEEAQVGS